MHAPQEPSFIFPKFRKFHFSLFATTIKGYQSGHGFQAAPCLFSLVTHRDPIFFATSSTAYSVVIPWNMKERKSSLACSITMNLPKPPRHSFPKSQKSTELPCVKLHQAFFPNIHSHLSAPSLLSPTWRNAKLTSFWSYRPYYTVHPWVSCYVLQGFTHTHTHPSPPSSLILRSLTWE